MMEIIEKVLGVLSGVGFLFVGLVLIWMQFKT